MFTIEPSPKYAGISHFPERNTKYTLQMPARRIFSRRKCETTFGRAPSTEFPVQKPTGYNSLLQGNGAIRVAWPAAGISPTRFWNATPPFNPGDPAFARVSARRDSHTEDDQECAP